MSLRTFQAANNTLRDSQLSECGSTRLLVPGHPFYQGFTAITEASLQSRITRLLKSKYLRRRILTSILIFFAVYIINFFLPRLVPGTFVSSLNGQSNLDPQQRQALLAQFGLNQDLWHQFLNYLRQTFTSFPPSFGYSFTHYPETVWQVVGQYLPWTLLLITVSQLLAWGGGVLLGAWIGWHPSSKKNSVLFLSSSFLWGVPPYWIGEILIFVLAIKLRLLPPALTSGVATGNLLVALPAIVTHSILPILTLTIYALPIQAMVMRNNMITVLREDFMSAAVARGIKERALIIRHAARNAILPSITNLALTFGALLSGAYIVEVLYSYPGMGYLITQSIYNHDFPVLQGVFFFSAALVIIANLLSDVAIVLLDPRVDHEML